MPRIVLLHGLGADRRAFQRFERLLPEQWNITSLDLLGHGDAPKPEHGYSLVEHAAYIAELLRALDGDEPRVLIGHSYGAGTSVAVAANYPELVAAIVLLDPVVALDPSREGSGTGRMIQAKREGHLGATVEAIFPDASPALQRWTTETWEQMAVGVVDELDPNWTRFAEHVTVPVAIIHGELELGGGGDLAADWFDEPVVIGIPGAGHYLHATHARETAAAIDDTLAMFGIA